MSERWYKQPWSWVFASILLVWGVYYGIVHICFHLSDANHQNWTIAGTFGDMFGALSCLFSGLAFAGLIVTIYQQNKSIKLQQEELVATRTEIKAQTRQFEKENKLIEYQLRKDDIYRRLEIVQNLEKNIEYSQYSVLVIDEADNYRIGEAKKYSGIAAISFMCTDIANVFETLFVKEKISAAERCKLNVLRNALYDSYSFLYPCLSTISVLLNDMKLYFGDDEFQMRREYTVVLGILSICMQNFLYLFRGKVGDAKIIEELMENGFFGSDCYTRCQYDEKARKLFLNYLIDNISVDQIRSEWFSGNV